MGPTGSVAWERAMKIQEVILRAMAKRITWWQAAEIIGIRGRQMRRWHWRYEKWGYDGLWDRRRGGPSPRRVPLAQAEQVLRLYGEKYFDFNVRHFHEKLREQHSIGLSYTWVELALQGAGLVHKRRRRGAHRQRRVRRPLPVLMGLSSSERSQTSICVELPRNRTSAANALIFLNQHPRYIAIATRQGG